MTTPATTASGSPVEAPGRTYPINPLTGGDTLITVKLARREGPPSTQGLLVTPGLAITAVPKKHDKEPDRYAITHTPTGLSVMVGMCGKHTLEGVAVLMLAAGIDWTVTAGPALSEQIKAHPAVDSISTHRFLCNGRWCEGDGPEPSSAEVRCRACGWQREEYDETQTGRYEWPLSEEEARELADLHECEPQLELRKPGAASDEWVSLR